MIGLEPVSHGRHATLLPLGSSVLWDIRHGVCGIESVFNLGGHPHREPALSQPLHVFDLFAKGTSSIAVSTASTSTCGLLDLPP